MSEPTTTIDKTIVVRAGDLLRLWDLRLLRHHAGHLPGESVIEICDDDGGHLVRPCSITVLAPQVSTDNSGRATS